LKIFFVNFEKIFRSFLFPNDLQLELEYWAETGEYSSEELQQVNYGIQ
jgi:hypothetical protein